MATLEEVYTQVLADETLKAWLDEAAKTPEGLAAFLAERGCTATPEETAAFLQEKQTHQGEISDSELDSVAGGCNEGEVAGSMITLGLYCAAAAAASAIDGNMKGEDGKILCASF